jgi:hypothetical protein
MSVIAVADIFGISGRRPELVAALADAEREAAGQPGCVRYSFAATIAARPLASGLMDPRDAD